jgi:Kef-type K+ transport system membrane component KefB
MEALAVAALLAILAFVASVISVEAAVSVAIIEILAGVFAGNVFGITGAPWLDFLAAFGSVLLTLLAGAEVDARVLREKFVPSVVLGAGSFLVPFLAAAAFAAYGLHWSPRASLIAGCALSTTSLAVVYAVLVETGLNATELGKLIMAATFVTDIGTALALSILFIEPNASTAIFFVVSALVIAIAPRIVPPLFERYGARVIEPEIKLILAVLLGLMLLAHQGKSHAVLPAFVLGLVLARTFQEKPALLRKLRVVAFGMVTPFFFLKGGMNVSLPALGSAAWALLAFFAVKLVAKSLAVFPIARLHMPGAAIYTTLLMSTGLTFGTISSMYGLQAGIIDRTQFSILVAVVIASAIVPTVIAQRWFAPRLSPAEQEEVLAREEESM